MADVLDVKFERPITVFKPQDVLDVVDRYCGWEIAKYLRDLFDEYENEDRETKLRISTDLESYESQIDSNTTAFQDILAEVAALEKELDQSRINREKLRKRSETITAIVNNQI